MDQSYQSKVVLQFQDPFGSFSAERLPQSLLPASRLQKTALDANEAIRKTEQLHPDLIALDYKMDRSDGSRPPTAS